MTTSGATRREPDERGDTLIEVLIALLVIGLTATAILGGFASSIAGSLEHRTYANIDTLLRSYASAATYQIQEQPSPGFVSCASPSSYRIVAAYPSSAAPGSQVEVFGTGFAPASSVTITLGATSLTGDIVSGKTTSSSGAVTAIVDLPSSGLTAGANSLTVTAGSTSQTGAFTVSSGSPVSTSLSQYSLSLSSVQYWNDGSFTGTCAHGGNAPQLLTVAASSPIAASDSLSFVVVNPDFVSSSAPTFSSSPTASFTVGASGSFTVSASGPPTPSLTESGSLPSGLTFVDNHDGTATISGTPASGTSGSYALTITASNGVLPDATQSFTLKVS